MGRSDNEDRVRALNHRPVRAGRYVLYWCRWNRRVEANHALLYAAATANRMDLPLVVFERLSCAYPTACDRFHTFVLEGVPHFQEQLRKLGIGYVFQLPRRKTARDALRDAMIAGAASVITDDCLRDTPEIDVKLEAVDASCIVPMSAIPQQSYAAYSIRPKIQRLLPKYLQPAPAIEIHRRCGEAFDGVHTAVSRLKKVAELVAECEIDHTVGASTARFAADVRRRRACLRRFLDGRLRRYAAVGKTSRRGTRRAS